MKNKNFYIKTINLLLIVIILISYQWITNIHAKEEELAKLQLKLSSAEDTITDVNDQLSKYSPSTSSDNETDTNTSSLYTDGTYRGTADGFGGTIEVEVLITDGQIASIDIIRAKKEDSAYLEMATSIIDSILDNQTIEVDTVSGATFTSGGIKDATTEALKKAVNE